jgi:hypothetical protein
MGCDCGLIICVIRLRGLPSELCTLGLIEPGESVIRVLSVLLSRRCDLGGESGKWLKYGNNIIFLN